MVKVLILLSLAMAVAASVSPADPLQNPGKKVVCYFGSWAVYRPGAGKFDVEDIDPHLCTHAIYGFAGITEDGVLKILDEWNELEENWGRGAMRRFTNMKLQNPNLKTLLAVGGWNEGSEKYSRMVETAAGRRRFTDSVIPFLQRYNFDGFDLDWEYPTQRGGRPQDKANFVLLCQEMRADFDRYGLLLTAAVSAGEATIEPSYNIPAVCSALHFINVMTYDFHGAWETYTGHHSPLYALPTETGDDLKLNGLHAINYWIDGGCPPEKLNMGMGSYGRGFLLDNAAVNGLYAPASQALPAGPYTREPGIWGYNEILEKFHAEPGQWTVIRNAHAGIPYAYNGRSWIGFDDPISIQTKARFARDRGLGGGMVWSVETDDFNAIYSNERYPLINAMKRTLNS